MLAKQSEDKNQVDKESRTQQAKSNRFLRYRLLISLYLKNFNSSDLNLRDFERIESKKQNYKSTYNSWENF